MTAPIRSPSVVLRPIAREDRILIRNWLAENVVRAWWGSPAAVEAEIAIAIESQSAICRMIEVDGSAAGYAHAFDAGLMDSNGDPSGEPGVWQCMFFIGSETHHGLGFGATALGLLAEEVLSTTLALGCETRMPVRNESAVREIETQGFRWRRVENDAALGVQWIMRRDRAG